MSRIQRAPAAPSDENRAETELLTQLRRPPGRRVPTAAGHPAPKPLEIVEEICFRGSAARCGRRSANDRVLAGRQLRLANRTNSSATRSVDERLTMNRTAEELQRLIEDAAATLKEPRSVARPSARCNPSPPCATGPRSTDQRPQDQTQALEQLLPSAANFPVGKLQSLVATQAARSSDRSPRQHHLRRPPSWASNSPPSPRRNAMPF
jgi:hypothetical protein